ncbi:MAG: DsrE family protein [Candidatus Krumholzibacteriia bacterium]
MNQDHLHILWTTGDPDTARDMVLMYATNARIHGWWDEVTLVVWGASARLLAADPAIQQMVRDAQAAGVQVTACKACAMELGVADQLVDLGVDVKSWGQSLTGVLRERGPLLSV